MTTALSTDQVIHNGCLFTECNQQGEFVIVKIQPIDGSFIGEQELFVKEKVTYYTNLLEFVTNNY